MKLEISAKNIILLVFFVLIIGGLGGLFLDKIVFPFLSSWPVFENWKFLRPETQLVITKREEIRIVEGINQHEVSSRLKNSLATVYFYKGKLSDAQFQYLSKTMGVIVSSDGVIIVPEVAIPPKSLSAVVLAQEKEIFPAQVLAEDARTGLAFLKIEKKDLPVAKQGFSKDMAVGERLVAIQTFSSPEEISSLVVGLAAPSRVMPSIEKVYDFNNWDAILTVRPSVEEGLVGMVFANKDAELVGILTQIGQSKQILRAEEIKLVLDNYFDDNKIEWPELNLKYKVFGEIETKLLGLPKKTGVIVETGFAPLRENDFVFSLDGVEITPRDDFQEKILRKPPGTKLRLGIIRDQEEIEVEVVP